MSKSDNLAERVLKKLGFKVEKLSVSNESGKKMPDFYIRHGLFGALVEAKMKEDSPEEIVRRAETLDKGCIYDSGHVLGRNETISGIIKKASKQLKSDVNFNFDFRIVFFVANCINASVVREQFIDTMYGRTTIIETPQKKCIPCYFYRNSNFYRRKELDAVIATHIDDSGGIFGQICLNPYSSNYKKLKNSEFLSPFGDNILDPIDEEKAGRAYIPDNNVERKEQEFTKMFSLYDPVLHHLQEKYKTGTLLRGDFTSPVLEWHPHSNATSSP